MNDDIAGAEEGLEGGNSSFHKLGKGIVTFIRATLGLEQDIMREAAERLTEAENSAYNDQRRSHHKASALNSYRSAIYEPGTEYLLCQSMAQLMAALVGVLSENLTESIKAFYKLRKAYIALDGIMQMETKYLESKATDKVEMDHHPSGTIETRTESHNSPRVPTPFRIPGMPTNPSNQGDVAETKLGVESSRNSNTVQIFPHLNADVLAHPVDQFIHSGASLCFGLLLLLISMVPPTFNKFLYIAGFKGDRPRGLQMLWNASKSQTLTGAIAAVTLLAFYNGFVRCCDILPDRSSESHDDIEGYPLRRLGELLSDMRGRFPQSQLWILEESRMKGAHKKLEDALNLLTSPTKSPLKQVEALCVFERSLDAMYLHKYELCAESFLQCVELNSWSQALYYYIAASSHLAIYRQNASRSPTVAAHHASKATELFRMAPQFAGKKRLLASQLPFDALVVRKVSKWQLRAKQWNIDFIDAIGVDPIEEMIYFWNGHSRMSEIQLESSLKNLKWSEGPENKTWGREDHDEQCILALLRASILRSLGKHEEAKDILQSHVLCHDKAIFKGHLKDDWTSPSAHYEMAANLWMERRSFVPFDAHSMGRRNGDGTFESGDDNMEKDLPCEEDREKVDECKKWLEKAARWESFELDARIGLKIAMAEATVQKWDALYSVS
ncbi:Mitochondrial outer membrane protein iml2 [Ophidiomyces ophidiicola]|nr:Mitochondrial outer membrane protein iml2 [Ophidiomyces ophidiicola]KAI1930244.1 Mitochondrial outer membrane protein iml2 [Ophidiomyces ophidiicola]KAI1967691.1 Mitochondrial outer membrane protein iml2 [Ophidiomyces ophidiicola]KAI2006795.1 Mitochondrial outer membrane protein iml2 [Ophidiomyces ophidiicola]KAI2024497.1 Mitochondrial outer membrane protein iml2 [Ophidiomyces ophidiicola]